MSASFIDNEKLPKGSKIKYFLLPGGREQIRQVWPDKTCLAEETDLHSAAFEDELSNED